MFYSIYLALSVSNHIYWIFHFFRLDCVANPFSTCYFCASLELFFVAYKFKMRSGVKSMLCLANVTKIYLIPFNIPTGALVNLLIWYIVLNFSMVVCTYIYSQPYLWQPLSKHGTSPQQIFVHTYSSTGRLMQKGSQNISAKVIYISQSCIWEKLLYDLQWTTHMVIKPCKFSQASLPY